MTLWGILQDYEVVDEDMNEAQIKKRGGQMLEDVYKRQLQVRRHHCQPGRRKTRRRSRLRFTAERQHGKTLYDCRRKLRKG